MLQKCGPFRGRNLSWQIKCHELTFHRHPHHAAFKVPYTIVIGEKEITSGEVVPRIRSDMAVMDVALKLGVEQFLKTVANENRSRVLKTSL